MLEAGGLSHGPGQCCAEPYGSLKQKDESVLHTVYNYI